ncbi:MAG: ATP-dependent DNA helicase RecG [Solirubrobacterales bacterium]
MRSFAGNSDLTPSELRAAPLHSPRPSALEAPLTSLSGVGPKFAEAARVAGVGTVGDLLLRLPHSHRDRTVVPVAELANGGAGTIRVEVLGASPRPFRRRGLSITSVKVGDESGSVRASWFNQPWVAPKLVSGTWLLLTGSLGKGGFRVSEYELLGAVEEEGTAGALVPVHPASEQIRPQRLRAWVERAIGHAKDMIEPLPAELRARLGLAGVGDAITAIHFPQTETDVERAGHRLAFEELFLYQALLASRKRAHRRARPAPRLARPGELAARWLDSLPFEPTAAQLAAFDDIDADVDSGEPMARLLMGEVGSGKTVVALYAMLRALEGGCQAVLMAPTETLAEQHAATLDRLLGAEAIPFGLLTGATPAGRRRAAVERLATGELGLAVGTHALIEPTVRFARLGLCVVDEQHRFGVAQRQALDSKGAGGMAPHLLQMTATPIPRTLSLTAYGDLDTTALRELPAGRRPVETSLVGERERAAAYELVRGRLREGRQAYVVCPLVSESEKTSGKAAELEAQRLAAAELGGFSIGVLHGQMAPADKAAAMEAFVSGATSVLVATTVIEVGVDVPNATVMIVEGAERYGISQLHQLRGRVGRGEHTSYCLLFPEGGGGLARRRLEAVAGESDGFKLAEVDLALRGEGEVLGTRQHGLPRFAAAELPEDTPTLLAAREEVLALLDRHGSLEAPALGPLMDAARARFGAGVTDPIPL